MRSYNATLVHVSIIRGGTYHDRATVIHHRAETGVINDTAATTLLCGPFCEQAFQVRLRTRHELWHLRLRRLLQALGSIIVGAVIAILGGITGLTALIVVTAVLSMIAYVAGAAFLCRIFAPSARYILTDADGRKVQSTDHKIVFGH
jgi:hypothetical protein